MKTRYYAVGAPIEELQGNFFVGVRPKNYTPEMLGQLSFYKQDLIRIFSVYDEAKEYAHGLRENAFAYSWYPRTSLSNSTVCPIFTLELNQEVVLGDLHLEQFTYTVYLRDGLRQKNEQPKEIALNFYEIKPNSIKHEDIIRAEFFNSRMAPVEFEYETQKQSCIIG